MKSSDRSIVVGLGVLGLIAAFWFLVLAPKRERASELESQVTQLETAVQAQEQLAAAGEQAKADFDSNYRSLVTLGKAVPEGGDTSSLFVQLDELSDRAGTRLRVIELSSGGGSAPPEPATTESTVDGAETPPEGGDSATPEETSTPTATSIAPATETAAATLPLGATVGTAGLPVMPYSLKLSGNYFQLAEFFAGLDDLVGLKDHGPAAHGRLLTVDGFSISRDTESAVDATATTEDLSIDVLVTSYVSPADQGLTGGASPTGPAPPTTTPASTETGATPTPTATVTP